MIRINLLPVRAARRRELVKLQAIYAVVGLVAVLVTCGWAYFSIGMQVAELEESNGELQSDIDRLKKIIGQVEEFKATKAELQEKIDVIEKLKNDRTGPVHLLDELANAIPDKAWVTSLSQQGEKVNIVGQAVNMESIADFTERLRRSPHIGKVEVGPTKRVQGKGLFLQEFLLIAYQKGGAAPDDKGKKGDK